MWLASYLGWIPHFGILRPAHRHPARRTLLMLAAHLAWGALTAHALSQLSRAETGILAAGPLADAPGRRRR